MYSKHFVPEIEDIMNLYVTLLFNLMAINAIPGITTQELKQLGKGDFIKLYHTFQAFTLLSVYTNDCSIHTI